MKRLLVTVLFSLLAGCATSPSWQQSYSAPYNTAASEEEARIWKKTDDAFKDRTDYLAQGKFEGERVYPKVIAQPAPVLTPELKKERGVVLAAYMIERDGSVRDARVIESSNPKLDAAAIDAVKKWRFAPGTVSGESKIWRYSQKFEF